MMRDTSARCGVGENGGVSRVPSACARPCLAGELYNKDEAYGKSYGQLAGDDMVQKSWPGLTCDRTDDDKWGWGEAKATADNSGTNCVYGDSWFCEDHYTVSDAGVMLSVSQLMWKYCNSTCNATDENLVSEYGDSAVLEGSSMLAACAFDGLKNMEEVCHVNNEHFVPFSSRRALGAADQRRLRVHESMGAMPLLLPGADGPRQLSNNYAPSVPNVNDTVIWINETYDQDVSAPAPFLHPPPYRVARHLASSARARSRADDRDSRARVQACNTHALCSTCITGANGTLDPYCEAFMIYYDMTGKWLPEASQRSHKYNVQLFWLNVHFWCNSTVLEAIKYGTFADDLTSGKIKNYDHVDVATNNTMAYKYFGGIHVHESKDYEWTYDDKP